MWGIEHVPHDVMNFGQTRHRWALGSGGQIDFLFLDVMAALRAVHEVANDRLE